MFGAIPSIARSNAAPPRVAIVGAGFGGLWAAKTLANAPVEVIVVDRENYHFFQPLLYQVATAGLSPADIAALIRSIVGAYRNVTVMLGEIVGVDVVARAVSIIDGLACALRLSRPRYRRAALQFGNLQIVARRIHLRFLNLLFQRLMPSFELRTMRLNGHARFLLMSDAAAR